MCAGFSVTKFLLHFRCLIGTHIANILVLDTISFSFCRKVSTLFFTGSSASFRPLIYDPTTGVSSLSSGV